MRIGPTAAQTPVMAMTAAPPPAPLAPVGLSGDQLSLRTVPTRPMSGLSPIVANAGWKDFLRAGVMFAAPLALAAGIGAAIAGGAGAAIGAAVGVAFWGAVGLGIYGNAKGWW